MHKHRIKSSSETPFFGPVTGVKPEPRAHGCVCVVDRCPCGAARYTNVNGQFYERGKWTGGQS